MSVRPHFSISFEYHYRSLCELVEWIMDDSWKVMEYEPRDDVSVKYV